MNSQSDLHRFESDVRFVPEVLHTDRLILRRASLQHFLRVPALLSDNVARMTGTFVCPMSCDEAIKRAEMAQKWWHLSKGFQFAVCLEGNGEIIGLAGSQYSAPNEQELGYWIGENWWGSGYGTESARAAIDFLREFVKPEKIVAGYFEDNPASARVQQKLGMRYTGETINHFCRQRGEKVKAFCMELPLSS